MKKRYASQYDKMTQEPVPHLVLELGLPTTVSMLVTNLYNLVDTWFVGTLGTSASGATGVVFGLMAILQAFGFMLGHGAGSNVSRRLGARNVEGARVFSATSFYLSLLVGGILAVLGLCFLTPLCRLLGSTDTILPYAREYAACILVAAPAMVSSCVMNNLLRYEGHASFAMVGLALGGVLNMAGDWVFIFNMNMGIFGAGLSTAISQYISAVVLFLMFRRKGIQSSFAPRYFTKKPADIANILATGMPNMARQGLSSISTMVLNGLAGSFGDAAVAAMSIVARVCNFLFCVGLGLGQGFQPVSAFNYGAGRYRRVRSAFLWAIGLGSVIMAVCGAVGFVYAEPLVELFRDDPEVIEIGTWAMRAQSCALVFLPLAVCGNMLFQSIGMSSRATFLSALRSGLLFIPLLLGLSYLFGLRGIQLAQPLADVLSGSITIPFVAALFAYLPPDTPDATAPEKQPEKT